MPSTPSVDCVMARHLVAEMASHGPDDLCAGLGFAPSDLIDPEFCLSRRQVMSLLRRSLRTGDNALGLAHRVGARHTLLSCHLMGAALSAAPTWWDMCALFARLPWAMGTVLTPAVRRSGTLVVLELPSADIPSAKEAFLATEFFAAATALGRHRFGPRGLRPSLVTFRHPEPSGTSDHGHFFGCEVRFGQSTNQMIVPEGEADLFSNPPEEAARAELEHLLWQRRMRWLASGSDLCLTVRRAIESNPVAPPTPALIASRMNMSERSLRRKLAEAGSGYQQIWETIRSAPRRAPSPRVPPHLAGPGMKQPSFGTARERPGLC